MRARPFQRGIPARLLSISATLAAGGALISGACGAVALASGALHSAPIAAAARVMSLTEHGRLHLIRSNGYNQLYEQGSSTGTFSKATLYAHLTVNSTNVTSYAFTAHLPGGTVNGQGRTQYYQSGSTSYYTGVLSVKGGTGKYAHASGALALKGAMNRRTYALDLQVGGKLHL